MHTSVTSSISKYAFKVSNKSVKTIDENKIIKKLISKGIATRGTIPLRVVASAIATLVIFWEILGRLKYVAEPGREEIPSYNSMCVRIGVATILFGLLLLIIGLAIAADFALGFSSRLQTKEENQNNQDLSRTETESVRETKATCRLIIRMAGTIISLSMLLWTTYTGFRLTTEPRRDSKYNNLAFSIGVIIIAFGLVYFIIGLAIAKEIALDLSGQLQQKKKGYLDSIREQQQC